MLAVWVRRKMVIARLRRLAMTRGPLPVRTWDRSSPNVTSRTHWSRSSMDQWPRSASASLVGEQPERVGDSGAVGPVQGDGDAGGPVVDPATEVEQVAQDGPVLVGVSEVGVEMLGQPRLAVVGQQPQHHLQAAALDPRAGPGGVRGRARWP
jgi:hypothetical protein